MRDDQLPARDDVLSQQTITLGMRVRFHPIIGGKDDGKTYTVRALGEVCGQQVAWLNGFSGCVALKALSFD
jgi:hypothetical protein